MRTYYVGTVCYCFPFETTTYLSYPHDDKLFGPLLPYMGRDMTEKEADELVSELVLRHPMIKDAMWLEIDVMWREKDTCGYYHNVIIKNFDGSKKRKDYTPTPIKWR